MEKAYSDVYAYHIKACSNCVHVYMQNAEFSLSCQVINLDQDFIDKDTVIDFMTY